MFSDFLSFTEFTHVFVQGKRYGETSVIDQIAVICMKTYSGTEILAHDVSVPVS